MMKWHRCSMLRAWACNLRGSRPVWLGLAALLLVLVVAGAIIGVSVRKGPVAIAPRPEPFELEGISGNSSLSNQLKAYAFKVRQPHDYTDATFSEAVRRKIKRRDLALVVNPFDSTQAMRTWAVQLTAGATNDVQTARILFDTLCAHRVERPLIKSRGYRTAKEMFLQWNSAQEGFICEEFEHMYVALARAVGLGAYGVAVEQDCYGMRNLHGCAAVFVSGNVLLVDPAYLWFGVPHKEFTILDDLQSTAVHLSGDGDLKVCKIGGRLGGDLLVVQVSVFDKLAGENRWPEARRVARSLERSHPNSPGAYYAMAVLAQEDQNHDEAAELLQKAIQLAPNTAQYYGMLGNSWRAKGKLNEARAAYENALRYCLNEECVRVSRQAIDALDAAMKQKEGAGATPEQRH
jgi:tetratricopeptide (TPR) repeat protein